MEIVYLNSFIMMRTPGAIVGPIADFLGIIYNALFDLIYSSSKVATLGIAIILFTLIVKLALMPLLFKQQKSMFKMRKLQPELDKIKLKYEDKKNDPQAQQKMYLEMQEFQRENGISVFGGCLPMLIQLPILYALFYIFQQPFMYVDVVYENYMQIANLIVDIEEVKRLEIFLPYAQVAADMLNKPLDIAIIEDVIQIVNIIKYDEWAEILPELLNLNSSFDSAIETKYSLETFITVNLVQNSGIALPGIIIPLLSGGTTYISSKMMSKNQPQNPNDPSAGMMKGMTIAMPFIMGFMTINVPAGLGIYWTVSNIIQMVQQSVTNRYFKMKDLRGEL